MQEPYRADTAFGREILRIAAEGRSWDRKCLNVSDETPRALRQVGFPDLPIMHTSKHVAHEVVDHGVDPELLSRLPELLEHPAALLDDLYGRAVVCVLAATQDGRAMVCPVKPRGEVRRGAGSRDMENVALSVYPRKNISVFLAAAERDGRLLYVDEQRLSLVMASLGRDVPEEVAGKDGPLRQSSVAGETARTGRGTAPERWSKARGKARCARADEREGVASYASRYAGGYAGGGHGRGRGNPQKGR